MALIQCLGSMESSIVDFFSWNIPQLYLSANITLSIKWNISFKKIYVHFYLYLNGYVCVCICEYIQNLHFFPCITFFKTNND